MPIHTAWESHTHLGDVGPERLRQTLREELFSKGAVMSRRSSKQRDE
jgi:hypothetical protein